MPTLPLKHPPSTPTTQRRGLKIDAHHHLWQYQQPSFAWIDDKMAELRRDFVPNDLYQELQMAHVDATVAVQARESLEETNWLLQCAQTSSFIQGVVGWAPLEADNLTGILDSFDTAHILVGFREIVQAKSKGYLDLPAFNRGISQLTRRNFTYDILIYEHQLEEATRFIDRHPNQRFVLDHAAKPKISSAELEPWRTRLHALARRPNVSCKLSGLVTEADWSGWTLESLRPYLDVCVAAFGPYRLLAGSDWPVCLVASTYLHWWNVLAGYFADFSQEEKQHVFGENAVDVYTLRGDSDYEPHGV